LIAVNMDEDETEESEGPPGKLPER
jgi:hypothetical protein